MIERENKFSSIEGVIYVVRESDKYLIAKRVKEDSNFKGQFLFPAGQIEEYDENWEAAVKREVVEERGARVNNCKFLTTTNYLHPNGATIIQHVYLIERNDYEGSMGNLEPEKEELHWLSELQLRSVCTSEPAKAVLRALDACGIFS